MPQHATFGDCVPSALKIRRTSVILQGPHNLDSMYLPHAALCWLQLWKRTAVASSWISNEFLFSTLFFVNVVEMFRSSSYHLLVLPSS